MAIVMYLNVWWAVSDMKMRGKRKPGVSGVCRTASLFAVNIHNLDDVRLFHVVSPSFSVSCVVLWRPSVAQIISVTVTRPDHEDGTPRPRDWHSDNTRCRSCTVINNGDGGDRR